MVTKTEQHWECYVIIFKKVRVPYENGETKESVEAWLHSPEGRDFIEDEFKNPHVRGSKRHPLARLESVCVELETIDDIEMVETTVSSWDTDPRV